MNQLHKEIASDQYWAGPAIPDTGQKFFAAELYDVYLSGAVSIGIDRAYQEIVERGASVKTLQPGEQLALDVPGGLLKVVQDMRTHPKKVSRMRRYDAPELFDEQAQAMIDELLFRGAQTGTKAEGPNGAVDIARSTVYFQNSPSQKQLGGKPSELLGRGGSDSVVFMRRSPVGHVDSYETRKDKVEARIVSAQVITRAGAKRARKLFDLVAVR